MALFVTSGLFACQGNTSETANGGARGPSANIAHQGTLTGVAACDAVDAGACLTSADCPSGICLTLHSGRVCVDACDDDAHCPQGMECEMRHTGTGLQGYCVPTQRGWTP